MKKALLFVVTVSIAILMVVVFMTSGCETKAEEKGKIEIGLGWDVIHLSRIAERDAVISRADELGCTTTFTLADDDVAKQQANIEGLIAKGVDAIIAIPIDSKAIAASIKEARDAGIPFVTIDRTTAPDAQYKPDFFASTDSYQQAYDSANALAKILKADGVTPKFIDIIGSLTDENAKNRDAGFKKVCEEQGYEIVAEVPTEWSAEKCRTGLQNAMAAHPEFNAIFSASDFLNPVISGLLQAANRWIPYGKEGHIYFASQDAFPSGWLYIRDGYIDTDTLWDIYAFAGEGVNAAVKLVNGEKLDQTEMLVKGKTLTRENYLTEPGIWGRDYAEK